MLTETLTPSPNQETDNNATLSATTQPSPNPIGDDVTLVGTPTSTTEPSPNPAGKDKAPGPTKEPQHEPRNPNARDTDVGDNPEAPHEPRRRRCRHWKQPQRRRHRRRDNPKAPRKPWRRRHRRRTRPQDNHQMNTFTTPNRDTTPQAQMVHRPMQHTACP